MIFSLLRRRRQGQDIEPLYGAMMTNALNPKLFLNAGLLDTFEGRFESVALHAALLLRRLRQLPAPAGDMAQEIVDRIFDGLDAAMRETGISDVGVPKRIKTFAKGFYGRIEAYSTALDAGDRAALAAALSRNACDGTDAHPALVSYVERSAAMLETASLDQFVAGHMPVAEVVP
jgi:cytochrome b pre-mRNA-processing protein 3